MDTNSIISVSGVVALLVAYAAVRDSEGGWTGRVGPMRWSLSVSWSSSIAVLLALALTLLGDPRGVFGLGLLMVLTPLIFRGMGTSEGAPKVVFFIVSGVMTWATFAILYLAAVSVPALTGSLPLLARIVIDAALVLAMVGAVMHSARTLAAAASGDGAEVWNLP
ncbi:MAG: hypothetical protein OXS29_05165 [bacterium]|nr:hypothetical protein [bacterium]MDE0289121.1 hypothetical protein [bacterium]MDE0440378.1 hypothetical protein [bacterium]